MTEIITKRFMPANIMRELALYSLFEQGWDGNWAHDRDPFLTDGRAMILKSVVAPKIRERLENRPSEYKYPKNLCKLWESCISKAHTKLSVQGVQYDPVLEMPSDLILLSGLSKPVGLQLWIFMVVMEVIGKATIYGSSPESAIVFWKKDEPVALLMPCKL